MTSNAHNRQVSTHSAYSLASPISLPTALPTSLHRQNSRHSFFAKLGKGRSRSNSRGQKSTSSEEWEWTCRGEDLEDNFTWPPEGWSDSVRSVLRSLLLSKQNNIYLVSSLNRKFPKPRRSSTPANQVVLTPGTRLSPLIQQRLQVSPRFRQERRRCMRVQNPLTPWPSPFQPSLMILAMILSSSG